MRCLAGATAALPSDWGGFGLRQALKVMEQICSGACNVLHGLGAGALHGLREINQTLAKHMCVSRASRSSSLLPWVAPQAPVALIGGWGFVLVGLAFAAEDIAP